MTHYERYVKRRRVRRKYWIDRYKLAKGCAECGFNSHSAALTFAHLDQRTKHRKVPNMLTYTLDRLFAEIRKCRILCANCHAIETYEEKHYEYRR